MGRDGSRTKYVKFIGYRKIFVYLLKEMEPADKVYDVLKNMRIAVFLRDGGEARTCYGKVSKVNCNESVILTV